MIRKMTEADLERVMEIWLDACIKGQSFIPEDYWRRHAEVVKKDYIPQSEVYVNEQGLSLIHISPCTSWTRTGMLPGMWP